MKALALFAASLLLVACGGGGGDLSTANQGKAEDTAKIQRTFAQEESQDLLVVFDDANIQHEAKALQVSQGIPSSHKSVVQMKVSRMAEKKRAAISTLKSEEAIVLKEYQHLPISFVRLQTKASFDKLLANPNVVGIYENKTVYRAGLAQSLPLIGQPQAAASGYLGAGTSVAVLDQRVDYSNPVFGSCATPGQSGCKVIVAQDAPGMPNDGLGFQDQHGTNVAATVLAVAPGAKIISLNVFNGEGARISDIVAAINWCIGNTSAFNIVAMNLSLADHSENLSTSTNNPYYSAFASARAAGILPIVAAGNDGHTNGLGMPAAVTGAVSVGAVYDGSYGPLSWGVPTTCTDGSSSADQVTCFSNSASYLTLLAPGCRDDAGFAASQYMCGTSQATPHVSGAAAVLRSQFPFDTLSQTISRLSNGVQITDARNGVTKPRLNLPRAAGLSDCFFSASPLSANIAAAGTTSSQLNVTASAAGCAWTASGNENWITLLSGGSGVGNGTIQFSVDPNNSSSARSGSILVADKSVIVSQAAGFGALSSSTNVWLTETYGYQTTGVIAGGTVTLRADKILNTSSTFTTGTLRLELWLTSQPFAFGSPGWRIGTYQISGSSNGTLGPNQYFSNINATVPLLNLPAPGTYYATLLVTEYDGVNCSTNNYFCTDYVGGFTGKFFIPDITAPSTPTNLVAPVSDSSSAILSWNASYDDVAVSAYRIYSNGTLIGRVASTGARVVGLQPLSNYQFAVRACDPSDNCSAASNLVSATTPGFSLENGWWWNPSEGGRGFAIEQVGNKTFMGGFLYNDAGQPTWFTASGFMNGKVFTAPMSVYSNGQTLSGSYQAPTQSPNSPGNITLDFSDPTHAVMTWPGGNVALQRFEIVPGSLSSLQKSFVPERGWWWNASEGGRGYTLEIQGDNMFIAGFMYGANGQPTWYVSTGKMSDTQTYLGNWTEYSGGQTMTGPYKSPKSSGPVASIGIYFPDAQHGTLYLPNGAIQITRFTSF